VHGWRQISIALIDVCGGFEVKRCLTRVAGNMVSFREASSPKHLRANPLLEKRRPHMSRKHILRDGLSLCSRRLPLCARLGQELQQSLVDLLRVCPSDVVWAIFDDN
jgi:hypothetical protein